MGLKERGALPRTFVLTCGRQAGSPSVFRTARPGKEWTFLLNKEIVLDNHLTVVYEQLPHLNSVAFGVWIGAGSRNEDAGNNGISHFIEHMVFKGTQKRSARDIACEADQIGGQINAFTGKDCTCYYIKTLEKDMETALDILSDMLFHSTFEERNIETERRVVLEEISMYEDDPEEMVHDLLTESIYREGPLGMPILGTPQSLEGLNKKLITEYMDAYYTPDNAVISVVGNFDEERLKVLLNKYFGSWKPVGSCPLVASPSLFLPGYYPKYKETEQTHICLGFRGLTMGDENIYPMMVLNGILGGGMSSRLFQNIREEKGLAYSIYSVPTSFRDVGLFSIYAASGPELTEEVIGLIGDEIHGLLRGGVSSLEVERSKKQLQGNFLLGLDSTSGRMSSLGKSQIITGRVRSHDEILKLIDDVTPDKIMEVARILFEGKYMAAALIGDAKVDASLLDSLR